MADDASTGAGSDVKPRILFIDAYDSFSNNIVSMLGSVLNAQVKILKIDELDRKAPDFQAKWHSELKHFDAVVCGPGPGSAEVESDVGLMNELWNLDDENRVPVLGICLGFQSLVHAHGGKIQKLKQGLHGQVRHITIQTSPLGPLGVGDIFYGAEPFEATLYHSLCVDIGQHEISQAEWPFRRWERQGNILPLAWVEETRNDDGRCSVERILMAARHITLPFWGLQYHPESVCTSLTHAKIIQNWMSEAMRWNNHVGRKRVELDMSPGHQWHQTPSHRESLLDFVDKIQNQNAHDTWMTHSPYGQVSNLCYLFSEVGDIHPGANLEDIVEFMCSNPEEGAIILDSSNNGVQLPHDAADVKGRYSIIALDVDRAPHFEHWAGTTFIRAYIPCKQVENYTASEFFDISGTHESFWQWATEFMDTRRVRIDEDQPTPFVGGFMGVVSYEMGLHHIGVPVKDRTPDMMMARHPDVCWVWVTKSLVIDHVENKAHIHYIRPYQMANDEYWHRKTMGTVTADEGEGYLERMPQILQDLREWLGKRAEWRTFMADTGDAMDVDKASDSTDVDKVNDPSLYPIAHRRLPKAYQLEVTKCQDFIREGHSYELCLTDETVVTRPRVKELPEDSEPGHATKFIAAGNTHKVDADEDAAYSRNYAHYHGLDEDESPTSGENETPPDNHIVSLCPSSPPSPAKNGEYSPSDTSWELYVRLRNSQPAPFGSYIRLANGLTVMSSSPERFLTYCDKGLCKMRPMKGTVKKSDACSTLEQAMSILHVPKEEAENLMIVDLVRHDLSGVCGSGRVSVPCLLQVEEYASVYQMVSVVHGQLPHPAHAGNRSPGSNRDYTGLDALASALPPGSMTGAPKKRSCEILKGIEQRERGIYSGVIGYHSLSGNGDWSVNIRCMFRWDDECGCLKAVRMDGKGCRFRPIGEGCRADNCYGEKWHVGAGGAVTILSTPEGETDEMFAKLKGTMSIFD